MPISKKTTPKKSKPKAITTKIIPNNVFAKALEGATVAKNIVTPYLPEMTTHTQKHASGMTIRSAEFLEEGLRIAESNTEFVSSFVDLTKYEEEVDIFLEAEAIISELNIARANWTAVRRWAGIEARREFNIVYGCVRELHRRNIAPATALYEEMSRLYQNHFGPRPNKSGPCGEEIIVIEEKAMAGKKLATKHRKHLEGKTIGEIIANLEIIE